MSAASQPRVRIAVVYDSWTGCCARLAERFAAGAEAAGAAAILLEACQADRQTLALVDGLALGSPVHQRGMSWPMKKFIDEVCEPLWFDDALAGRAGAVFTTGGGHGDAGGGCEMAQLSLLANLAALGLVLLPFPKMTEGFDEAGMHWGPHVRVTRPDMSPFGAGGLPWTPLAGVYHHGAAFARLAWALKSAGQDEALFNGGARWPSAVVRRARAAAHEADA